MSAKDQLITARDALQAEIDKKLAAMPEWKALQQVERAIEALGTAPRLQPLAVTGRHRFRFVQSYASLAIEALKKEKRPLTTPEVIEYVGKNRTLSGDPEKNKINISSSLSKENRLENILWRNNRAWWFADQPAPLDADLLQKGEPDAKS
jgi:hypothetical protein